MSYQILNPQNNPKRKALLKKELKTFSNHLQQLSWQSHTVLSGVKEIQQRKNIQEQLKRIKK